MSLVLEFVSCVVKNLVNVPEDVMDGWVQNPKALQKVLTDALCPPIIQNGARAVIVASNVLKLVDTFNHAEFLGKDWEVVDCDEREDSLTEVNWSKVNYENCLKEGESSITGEEKLKRLKIKGKLRFGGRAFFSLWKDYQEKGEASVLEQLYKTKRITYVDFFGLVFQAPGGYRGVLYLYRSGDGRWDWYYCWLAYVWYYRDLSAVSRVSLN